MQKFIFLFVIYVYFYPVQFCNGSNNSFDISMKELFEFTPITPSPPPENIKEETPCLTPIGQRFSDYHDQECMAFFILENSSITSSYESYKWSNNLCIHETFSTKSKDEQQENAPLQEKNNTSSSDEDNDGTRPSVSPRHFQETTYIHTAIIRRQQKPENIPEEPIDTCWTSFCKKIKLLLHLKS